MNKTKLHGGKKDIEDLAKTLVGTSTDNTLTGGDLGGVVEVLNDLVTSAGYSVVNDFQTALYLSEVCSVQHFMFSHHP
jgi:hypothetical protein